MINFDELARQMRSAQSEAATNRFYLELFALDTWYFLHDPDDMQHPLVLELSDGSSLLPAFTDADRADRWAAQSGHYSPDAESPVMEISVTQCLLWLWGGGLAEADRVSSLCFNLDGENFLLPLTAIQQMTIEVLPDRQWRCKGGITPSFLGAAKSADELNLEPKSLETQ